jgi:hypothetical protein
VLDDFGFGFMKEVFEHGKRMQICFLTTVKLQKLLHYYPFSTTNKYTILGL